MKTVTEWRVTGDPSTTLDGREIHFPPYSFVWYSNRAYDAVSRPIRSNVDAKLTAEEAAKRFVIAARSDWADGPHLHRRTVTYTEWEEVE